MFGRLLEIGLATREITASIPFYERLGFSPLATTDAWSHRYGVVSDTRIQLGDVSQRKGAELEVYDWRAMRAIS